MTTSEGRGDTARDARQALLSQKLRTEVAWRAERCRSLRARQAAMREFDVAQVAHSTPTRLRLRVPARRHDGAFFAKLVQEIERDWALIRVEANPLTGSVTLSSPHRLDWSSIDLAPYGLAVVHATADRAPAQTFAVSLPASPGVAATCVATAPTSADAGLATLGVQLVSSLLTGRPLAALLQWVIERLLQSLLSHLLVSQGLRA